MVRQMTDLSALQLASLKKDATRILKMDCTRGGNSRPFTDADRSRWKQWRAAITAAQHAQGAILQIAASSGDVAEQEEGAQTAASKRRDSKMPVAS